MVRIHVQPRLITWARERAGHEVSTLQRRFPRIADWETGAVHPTLRQLESFAQAVHVPFGYLFLAHPPEEQTPVADFRTMAGRPSRRPSPDLLETLHLCQQRQEWYREFTRTEGSRPLAFVGSVEVGSDVVATAARMRQHLGFDIENRSRMPASADDALRALVDLFDTAGVLVMISGVVGNNNTRRLDPDEFRGFAIVDEYAPLIFVNGADTKAAQFFTLAHELAHLWVGQSALSDASLASTSANESERWCNHVAAEFLVPLRFLAQRLEGLSDQDTMVRHLAREFSVSTLVILRRLLDLGKIDRNAFSSRFDAELARMKEHGSGTGGNFFNTLGVRNSKRFARAVVVSTIEGRSSFTEASRLLGFKKMSTFKKLSTGLGIRF